MRKVLSLIAMLLSVSVFAPAVSADDAKVKKVVGGLIEILGGARPGSSTSPSSTATGATSGRRRPDDGRLKVNTNLDGLVVKVKSCTANENGDVVIIFTLDNQTNKDYNGSLFGGVSEVYDDEGNIYKTEYVINFGLANGDYNANYTSVDLPSGILVKYKMKIKDVDPAASMLKLVKVEFRLGNLYPYSFTLKNVPITREGD